MRYNTRFSIIEANYDTKQNSCSGSEPIGQIELK